MKATPKQTNDSAKRQILIVDDHPMMRRGLMHLISQDPELEVCGEAETANQALTLLQSLTPDLVVADLTIPGKSGLELVKDMRALHPSIAVLVASMHDESFYADRVLRAGARGYIMKNEGPAKMLQAIHQVLQGKIYVSERISSQILDIFAGGDVKPDRSVLTVLSDREFEVFQLMGQVLGNREIGERLHLSPKTVDSHRQHIKQKLHLRSMSELVKYAIRWAATHDLI